MLMTCVMRTMRQLAFFRRIAIIPPVPFLSLPSAPLSLPLALPVMPAGPPCHARWPSLSFSLAPSVIPAVFSGNSELNL